MVFQSYRTSVNKSKCFSCLAVMMGWTYEADTFLMVQNYQFMLSADIEAHKNQGIAHCV